MLLPVRGEGVARKALLLALLTINSMSGQGCKQPAIVNTTPQAVRVDALLTLHPAWAQVIALDQTVSKFTDRLPMREPAAVPLTPMPPDLNMPAPLPPTVTQDRQQRTRDYETQYLQQLAETLRLQDEIYLTRLSRRLEQEAETQYQKEFAEANSGDPFRSHCRG